MAAYWRIADYAPDAAPIIVDFAAGTADPVEVLTKIQAETGGNAEVIDATLAVPIAQAELLDEYSNRFHAQPR